MILSYFFFFYNVLTLEFLLRHVKHDYRGEKKIFCKKNLTVGAQIICGLDSILIADETNSFSWLVNSG